MNPIIERVLRIYLARTLMVFYAWYGYNPEGNFEVLKFLLVFSLTALIAFHPKHWWEQISIPKAACITVATIIFSITDFYPN